MLDKRLKAIAELVTINGVLCDVGTDHCSLPIYLAGERRIKKSYAIEVTETNLLKAKNNINIYNSRNNIKLNIIPVLSDGLKETDHNNMNDITDISIAGMGGENIVNIIKNSDIVKKGINLILQANSKVEILRNFLYNNSYTIKKEVLVYSTNFLYVIINANYKIKKEEMEEAEEKKGCNVLRLRSNTENFVRYLMGEYLNPQNSEYYDMYKQKTIKRLEKILEDLKDSGKVSEFGTAEDIKYVINRINSAFCF